MVSFNYTTDDKKGLNFSFVC